MVTFHLWCGGLIHYNWRKKMRKSVIAFITIQFAAGILFSFSTIAVNKTQSWKLDDSCRFFVFFGAVTNNFHES